MSRVCEKCGKLVQDDSAVFCPYCAANLPPLPQQAREAVRRTGFSIAAGVLTIIGACVSMAIGVLGLFVMGLGVLTSQSLLLASLMVIFGIIGFSFGLTGGILTLKRKYLALSIAGISLLMTSGLVIILAFVVVVPGAFAALAFGLPIVILSVLGLVFTVVARGNFPSARYLNAF